MATYTSVAMDPGTPRQGNAGAQVLAGPSQSTIGLPPQLPPVIVLVSTPSGDVKWG